MDHLFWRPSSAGGIKYEENIEVGGGMKVGTTTATCSANIAGMLKYNSNCMSYCNGNNWTNISCPVNGVCGSAHGTTVSAKPTT
ncbi:MAG: hypothetical protein LBD75_05415, partial [Candidatus Peribacteria bacterium]|nr:hypothetical protein [Candidatus Peribacteria bacterium]